MSKLISGHSNQQHTPKYNQSKFLGVILLITLVLFQKEDICKIVTFVYFLLSIPIVLLYRSLRQTEEENEESNLRYNGQQDLIGFDKDITSV